MARTVRHPPPFRGTDVGCPRPLRGSHRSLKTTGAQNREQRELELRDPPDPRRPDAGPDHGRPRTADLPDDVVRLPDSAARRRRFALAGARPHLHAHRQPHAGGRREPHRRPRGRRRRAARRVAARPPRRSRSSTSPRPATTSSPARRSTAARTTCCTTRCPSSASRRRSSTDPRRRAGVEGRGPAEHQAVLRARPSPTRRPTSSTSSSSPASRTRTASRSSSTTRSRRRT